MPENMTNEINEEVGYDNKSGNGETLMTDEVLEYWSLVSTSMY